MGDPMEMGEHLIRCDDALVPLFVLCWRSAGSPLSAIGAGQAGASVRRAQRSGVGQVVVAVVASSSTGTTLPVWGEFVEILHIFFWLMLW